jgi:hypothetical protein
LCDPAQDDPARIPVDFASNLPGASTSFVQLFLFDKRGFCWDTQKLREHGILIWVDVFYAPVTSQQHSAQETPSRSTPYRNSCDTPR